MSVLRKGFISFLALIILFSSAFTSFPSEAEASTPEIFSDPLLEEWLPKPGESPQVSSYLPQENSEDSLVNTENTPSLLLESELFDPPSDFYEQEEYVDSMKGELSLSRDDFILSTTGVPVTIQRLYQQNKKEELSAFGYGWTFPYEYYIQMFEDFHISEFRSDGSQVNYLYEMNDEDLEVDEYDDDPLIYYPLDKGKYTTEGNEPYQLQRISKNEYQVTHADGLTYTFYGYKTATEG